ncbi:transcriptional activator of glycolytic enzymes-domain-containing protein, partial [Corynascus novoguineensis]
IESRIEAIPAELDIRLQACETRLRQAQSSELRTLLVTGLQAATTAVQPATEGAGESRYASAQSSVGNSRLTSQDPVQTNHTPELDLQPGLDPDLQPPRYRMCRAVKTVEALWREWTVGLRGQPAVAELDRKWANRWRSGRQSELQWYSLRLEVIREIQRIAQEKRIGEQAAMHSVSMQQQQTGCSLDQFCKQLRANRKACTPARPRARPLARTRACSGAGL